MGQQWKNPPLYFTVAQVRFNAILNLDAFLPQLQDRLRKAGYPDYKALRRFVLTLTATAGKEEAAATESHATSHSFSNMDGTSGFVLAQDSFAFQTTRYENFERFTEELLKGLAIVHETVELSYYERIGLRYLDAVMPSAEDDLTQYIVPEVLGLSAKLPKLGHVYTETLAYDEADNRVISRTVIQQGRIGLPPDLGQVNLAVNERFTNFEGPHAILDNDAIFEGRQAFVLSDVQSRMASLRTLIGNAFKACITPDAIAIWKEGHPS